MEKNNRKSVMEELQQEQEDDDDEEFHEDFRCSSLAQQHAGRISLFPKNAYATWLSGNGPKVHIGVGCDFCGAFSQMCPIIGERYKCKDCMEKIGFDLCEARYHNPVNVSGRFNQQHKPEHKFEIVEPLNIGDLLFKIYAELSANDGSDTKDNRDDVEDALAAYIFSVDVSVDPGDDSDDPSSEPN